MAVNMAVPIQQAQVLNLGFEGFQAEAFEILERLREAPHIGQYRIEKEGIRRLINAPFKRYRDDLVVNWVLPNQLPFETERNVFSRLLKNDFGAGGCHHHKWMSFYRFGSKRLLDVQLSHSLWPDQFRIGLFVGDYATIPLKEAKTAILDQPSAFLALLNPLLEGGRYRFGFSMGTGVRKETIIQTAPIGRLDERFEKAHRCWIRHAFSRAEVLAWGPELVRQVLNTLGALWPIYLFWTAYAVASEG